MRDEKGLPSPPCTKVRFCEALRETINPRGSHGKGLSEMFGWLEGEDGRTLNPYGSARRLGVTYHTRANTDGYILNFCPWCGVNLRELFKTEKVAGVPE